MGMRKSFVLAVTVGIMGCGLGRGPKDVAELYWTAIAESDREAAQSFATADSRGDVQVADEDLTVARIVLTDVERADDRATVATTIEAAAGSMNFEIEFETILTRADGGWRVAVDETNAQVAQQVVQNLFGSSLDDLGASLGQALGEAFGGMAEGLAEGLGEAMGSLGEALQNVETQFDQNDLRDRMRDLREQLREQGDNAEIAAQLQELQRQLREQALRSQRAASKRAQEARSAAEAAVAQPDQ